MANLPESLAMTVGRVAVYLFGLCIPRYRTSALRNLEIVFPELSVEKREQIYRESLNALARNLYTFARLPDLTREDIERAVDFSAARKLLEEIDARGKSSGLMILTLHYGTFELLAQAQTVLYRPISILARDFGLPRLDRWWKARREKFGSRVFSRAGGFREIVSRLKSGDSVAILFDQNVKANYAEFVPFFNVQAATTRAIGVAALRSDCSAVVCAMYEKEPWKFEILFEEIENPNAFEGTSEEKIRTFLTKANQAAEKIIRAHPEQWFWIHRRFKTRPKGFPESVYDSTGPIQESAESRA